MDMTIEACLEQIDVAILLPSARASQAPSPGGRSLANAECDVTANCDSGTRMSVTGQYPVCARISGSSQREPGMTDDVRLGGEVQVRTGLLFPRPATARVHARNRICR